MKNCSDCEIVTNSVLKKEFGESKVYYCNCGHLRGFDRKTIELPNPFQKCHSCSSTSDNWTFIPLEEYLNPPLKEFYLKGAL